jgi:hypothetical protein
MFFLLMVVMLGGEGREHPEDPMVGSGLVEIGITTSNGCCIILGHAYHHDMPWSQAILS